MPRGSLGKADVMPNHIRRNHVNEGLARPGRPVAPAFIVADADGQRQPRHRRAVIDTQRAVEGVKLVRVARLAVTQTVSLKPVPPLARTSPEFCGKTPGRCRSHSRGHRRRSRPRRGSRHRIPLHCGTQAGLPEAFVAQTPAWNAPKPNSTQGRTTAPSGQATPSDTKREAREVLLETLTTNSVDSPVDGSGAVSAKAAAGSVGTASVQTASLRPRRRIPVIRFCEGKGLKVAGG